MATVNDISGHQVEVASNSKANAGLTTGIIGTSLAGLLALGGMAGFSAMCNNNNYYKNKRSDSNACDMTSEDLYIERKQAQNFIDTTKEFYQGKLDNQRDLTNAFFEAYKRDVDNSFALYKNQRDGFDMLNQKITDSSFGLYKNQRDEKDELNEKISKLQSKVDVMSAIRPYQDALINAKIDKNAILSDYKLSRRTCRMIEGQLVLPDTPEVTGYSSYYPSINSNCDI